jgi:hypothetical protein
MSGSFCVNDTKAYKIAVTDATNAIANFYTAGSSKSVSTQNGMMVFTNTLSARTCFPWSYEITTKLAGTYDVTSNGELMSVYNCVKEEYYGSILPEPSTTATLKVSYETRTQAFVRAIPPIFWLPLFV